MISRKNLSQQTQHSGGDSERGLGSTLSKVQSAISSQESNSHVSPLSPGCLCHKQSYTIVLPLQYRGPALRDTHALKDTHLDNTHRETSWMQADPRGPLSTRGCCKRGRHDTATLWYDAPFGRQQSFLFLRQGLMAHSPDQLQSHSVEEDDLEPQGLAGITGLLLHTGFIQLWMELRALGVLVSE